jgi:hypothetical protein
MRRVFYKNVTVNAEARDFTLKYYDLLTVEALNLKNVQPNSRCL